MVWPSVDLGHAFSRKTGRRRFRPNGIQNWSQKAHTGKTGQAYTQKWLPGDVGGVGVFGRILIGHITDIFYPRTL